jgi:hypothetical protein
MLNIAEESQPTVFDVFQTLKSVLNEHERHSKLMRDLINANEEGQKIEEELRTRTRYQLQQSRY